MPKKTYTDEFRRDAVDLLNSGGKPLTQIAKELGVHPASLRRWRDAFLGASAGSGNGAGGDGPAPEASAKELWDENLRLRREVRHLQRQREILKKAASILAEDPRPGMQ